MLRFPAVLPLLCCAILAACSGRDPVLGSDGVATRAPAVTAVAPTNGATAVSVNASIITAAFNQAVAANAGAAGFMITCAAPCVTPAGGLALDVGGSNATFSLEAGASLAPLTLYTVTVNGYRSVASGLSMDAPFTWAFTTGATPDAVRPIVTLTVPATSVPEPTGVATNSTIAASFSEEMAPATLASSMLLTCDAPCVAPAGSVGYVVGSKYAVFTPAAALVASSTYTMTISAAATDVAGNALAGNRAVAPAAGSHVWRFTTGGGADTSAPSVSATSPAASATGVAINALITASFSEPMNPASLTTATVTLACPGGNAITGSVGYGSVGNIATFTPTAPLPASTLCVASVTVGARDAANNAMASTFTWSFATGAAGDVTPPAVGATTPAASAPGVAINTLVTASFNEAMNPTTLTPATFTLACLGVPQTGTVGYAVNGSVATLTPAAPLPSGTTCVATVSVGARDAAGNALTAPFAWGFTTGALADTTAPTASATQPLPGESGVALNTLVTVNFSETMNPLTISTATFTLACPAGAAVTGTVAYAAGGTIATFTPVAVLPANTLCVASISTGAMDVASNPLAGAFNWTFTTGATPDTTAPSVSSTSPVADATGVAINTLVTASFNESMNPLTLTEATFEVECPAGAAITGTVGYAVGGSIATFTPAATLPASIVCVAALGTGVRDDSGNALASAFNWSFTTGVAPDVSAPTVLSANPANGAVGVCVNKTVSATFSEAMDPLTITSATLTLTIAAGASVTGVVAYDAQTRIATFNPVDNLIGSPATSYAARLVGGAAGMKDLAGNALAVDSVTTFTTNAATCASAPALGAAAPFGALGGASTLTNDGLNTVINGDIGVAAASTTITGLRDFGGNVYTVTPANDGLVNGLVYTLTAPPGSVPGEAVAQARAAALLAFNAISPANLPGGIDVSSLAQCPSCGGAGGGADELAGRVLPPGIYLSVGSYDIGGAGRTTANLTLDASGDADAVWVFQTAVGTGALNVGLTGPATPAVPIQVQLINGAQARNVFWYVPAGAVIGTGSTVNGTLLANAAITISTTGGSPPSAVTTTINGRAITLSAGTTMTNTVINLPAP